MKKAHHHPLSLVLLVVLATCTPPGPPVVETPLIETLGQGAFLPDGWLDLQEISRRQTAEDRNFDAGTAFALTHGWGPPEDWGVWALGMTSSLTLHTRDEGPFEFVLRAKAPVDPEGRLQHVWVVVNGTLIGDFDAGTTWHFHRLPIPDGVVKAGDNYITLRYAFHIDGIEGHDNRPLALAVVRAGLLASQSVVESGPNGPPLKADPTRDALFFLHPGRYVVPYTVPETAETLSFGLQLKPGRNGANQTTPALDLTILTLDGERHPMLHTPTDQRSAEHSLPLQAFRGRQVLLAFEARLPSGPDAGRIEIRKPRVRTLVPKETEAVPVPETPASLPDILLIVLDAARADHFGSYGYHRDTTPRFDRLAAESLVFKNIVAECPYTLCSSPSFMSGLSFTQHGIHQKGLRLPDDVETLANILRAEGYRTVGFTANPNNGRATGADKGFDEFYELWQAVRGRDRTHPETLTNVIRGRMEQGFGDQPVFILAHYVPPHEPYDPDPEHDIFGDPDYNGPVTGLLDQTRAIFFGEIAIDDADLEELEALYDGNLRQADAWVPNLFDAQREAGRWDNTIVLVTSDHGEAFGEHGEIGHNTTLFREMLDVPFILRLPESMRPANVDVDRLASLASVPATLLGLLDREPDPRATAPDLLTASPATPSRECVVPLRTSNPNNPIFGLQSERWKVMIRYRDILVAALYDLTGDPTETTDRAREAPLLFAGMLAMLEQQLWSTATAVGNTELSPEDEEMLRSLGYI